jgi:hypothetical protein
VKFAPTEFERALFGADFDVDARRGERARLHDDELPGPSGAPSPRLNCVSTD